MSGIVPIRVAAPNLIYDAILIDDDVLVRATWEARAKVHKKLFRAFDSKDAFLFAAIPPTSVIEIFIDQNLGHVNGVDVAEDLHKRGYRRLHLATGYEPESIVKSDQIESIRGKSPPWS